MLLNNLHAIEVLGTMLFRRAGNATRYITPCTVVTGKCAGDWTEPIENGHATALASVALRGEARPAR